MTPLEEQKKLFRERARQIRESIPNKRRQEASDRATEVLQVKLNPFHHILSFASFGSEINTWPINRSLAEKGKLLLPTLVNNEIWVYHVTDIPAQTSRSPHGIMEPLPDICEKADLQKIDFILVPAFAFDTQNHRIGYGKGHYDRFLKKISRPPTYGLGFKEQLFQEGIPASSHDVPLKDLLLF